MKRQAGDKYPLLIYCYFTSDIGALFSFSIAHCTFVNTPVHMILNHGVDLAFRIGKGKVIYGTL
jgi:hypothetical protein